MIKNIQVEGIGEVVFARRRGTRSIRLSVSGGRVRLGAPYGVSERQAIEFALRRADWILKHKKTVSLLLNNSRVGKAHVLRFEPGNGRITTKLVGNAAIVRLPLNLSVESAEAQNAAKRIAKKALLLEAESLLPKRLQTIALQTGQQYKSFETKFIKSRWGSCSNQGDIVLNAYLIQLPWEIIDYVIIHELAHVKHHNHSQNFWAKVAANMPDFKDRRKTLKAFQTEVIALPTPGLTG